MKKLALTVASVFLASLVAVTSAHAGDKKKTQRMTPVYLPMEFGVNPMIAKQGESVKYVLKVKNKSGSDIGDVNVAIDFPAGITCNKITDSSTGNCSLTNGGRRVVCSNVVCDDDDSIEVKVKCDVDTTNQCVEQTLTAYATLTVPGQYSRQQGADLRVKCKNTSKNECSDGKDNDGDGWIDYPQDPGCSSRDDSTETDPSGPQCDNCIDDDNDGKIDFPKDPGCTSPKDNTEKDTLPQCSDKIDNDRDNCIDMADPGCENPHDNDESDQPECSDGKDNDKDGKIDGVDPGCKNPLDDDESDDPEYECSDKVDNDRDGKKDFPADPGCTSPHDDDESDDPLKQCEDCIDNDNDGLIDFPQDPGCTDPKDDDEKNSENPITPTVSCIFDNGDGTGTAFFGYVNSSNQAVTVQAGANDGKNVNVMSPGNPVQGQPSTFQPGSNSNVFSAIVPDGGSLKWTVMVNGSKKREVVARKDVCKMCEPIKPLVECVDQKSAGLYTARFGYDNKNDFEVPLPIGQYNLFVPDPKDRGQPNKFFKGLVKNAFTVDFNGSDLTWKLATKAVTADKNTKECNPNLPPVCNANGPYVNSCQGTQTKVKLDGSASKDPEGKPLTYKWTTTCGSATFDSDTSAMPTLTLTGPGSGMAADCTVSLTVNDNVRSSSCQSTVKVPACNIDCKGTPGGTATIDQCGVCGGDGKSCLDCAGTPNGGKVVDKCGVCGGNNSCVDCAGTPNGGKVPDKCGVCGGDGKSCDQCNDTDILSTLFAMDSNSKQQQINANNALKRLENNAKDNKTRQYVANQRILAEKLHNENWTLTWSLPQIVTTCSESSTCAQTDNSITINAFNTNADSLRDISQEALRNLAKVLPGGKLRSSDKKIGVGADRLYNDAVELSAQVPRFQSVCN